MDRYHSQIAGPATSYLESRGLGAPAIDRFKLGYSGDTGDYRRNRLTIPYLTPAGPWTVKYRCIVDHGEGADCKSAGHEKYYAEDGAELHLFNASALLDAETVVIVEGEIDAITGSLTGIPHVGYPGAQAWRANKFWRYCFDSVDTIIIVADGDIPKADKKTGIIPRYGIGEQEAREVADSLRKSLPDATVRVVVHDVGYDTNKAIRERGQMPYLELIGII